MRKSLTLLACGSALAFAAVPASAAVYVVSQSGGGVSATGTITTDGTLGSLGNANVIDWQFNLNDGSGTFSLNGSANSQRSISGSGLTATATGLFFDFSGAGFALFQNPSIGSGVNFICFAGNNVCGGGTNRTSITVSNFGGGFAQQGVQQIGRLDGQGAVPEPATWALMMLGFGGIGYAMRRRASVKTTVSYA